MIVSNKEDLVDVNKRLEITLTFTAEEVNCLLNDLPGIEGIIEWFSQGPSQNKIAECKKRLLKEWIPKLRDDSVNIPADDSELLPIIFSHRLYKDRMARKEDL